MSQSLPSNNTSEEVLKEDGKLENLFIKFSEEIDHHEKSRILYSLVQAYLQCFKNELETNIKSAEFLELLSQVPLLCEKFLQTPESSNIDDIVNKSKNLESATVCFHTLLLCLEGFYMTNKWVIMIKISLNFLSQGYMHCKESEIIYDDLLEQFADQLGAFFKEIENLQRVVLQHLGKLDVTKFDKEDVQIDFIVVEMGNLCQIVFSLDADVALELWGQYLRIMTVHKKYASKNVSNINEICNYLASNNVDLLLSIKSSLEENYEEDKELAAKLSFYLDALSDLINLFPDSFIKKNTLFASVLLNCLLLCYSPFVTEKTSLPIIKTALKKNVFILLSHLCTDIEFLESVPFLPHDIEFHLSIILLKLYSLQYIKSTSLELRGYCLESIFSLFSLNYPNDDMMLVQLSIPQCTLTKTKSDELVTLYQLSYNTIMESLKLMPDSFIEKLESTIFKHLASSSDVTYLLISDVWIHRLRCSTIEFLEKRCYAILQNLHKENINNYKIENLTKRMLRFLPVSYKETILNSYSSLKFIQERQNIQHRYGTPDHTSTENEIKITSDEDIKVMISQLSTNSSDDDATLVKKTCSCLELCTSYVNVAGCSEIFQFLELASELFKTDIYEVQITTLSFLKSLGSKTMLEHDQEFEKIVITLACLFSEAMHSKNYIVSYEARNIFLYFAKCTPHVKIMQETLKKNPTLKEILKSYMNTVPVNNFISEKEKTELLQKQILKSNTTKFEIPPKTMETLRKLFSRANWKCLI